MSEAWPIHTVVLDLDDTLIAERDYVASGFRAVGGQLEREIGIKGFSEAAWQLFEAGKRGRIFDEAFEACGAPVQPGAVARMVEVYRSHLPNIELLPDARELLDWAMPRFALAVISDGYLIAQRQKVAAINLSNWTPVVFITDAWGREYWKPSPRAFEEVMKARRGPASGYVYVADNPRKDFIAPRALGWRTVRIRRQGGEHYGYEAQPHEAADCEVGDLRVLTTMFDRLVT